MFNSTESISNPPQGRFQQQQRTKTQQQHFRVPFSDHAAKRNDDETSQKHGQAQNAQNHYHDQQRGQNRQNKGREYYHGNGNGNYRKNHRGNNQQYGSKRYGQHYNQAKAQINGNSERKNPPPSEPTAIKENPKKIENVQIKIEQRPKQAEVKPPMPQKVMQEDKSLTQASTSLSEQSSSSSTSSYAAQARMSISDSSNSRGSLSESSQSRTCLSDTSQSRMTMTEPVPQRLSMSDTSNSRTTIAQSTQARMSMSDTSNSRSSLPDTSNSRMTMAHSAPQRLSMPNISNTRMSMSDTSNSRSSMSDSSQSRNSMADTPNSRSSMAESAQRMSMSDSCLSNNNMVWMKPIHHVRFNKSDGQIAMPYSNQPHQYNDMHQQHMHYQNRVTYTKEYVNQNYAHHAQQKYAYSNDQQKHAYNNDHQQKQAYSNDYQQKQAYSNDYRQNSPPKDYYQQKYVYNSENQQKHAYNNDHQQKYAYNNDHHQKLAHNNDYQQKQAYSNDYRQNTPPKEFYGPHLPPNGYNNDYRQNTPPKEFYGPHLPPNGYNRPNSPQKDRRMQQNDYYGPSSPPNGYYRPNSPQKDRRMQQQQNNYYGPSSPPKEYNRPNSPKNEFTVSPQKFRRLPHNRPDSPQSENDRPRSPYRRRQHSPHRYRGYDSIKRQIDVRLNRAWKSRTKFRTKFSILRELYDYIGNSTILNEFSLHLVGSTVTGFGLESSDVDICLATKQKILYDPRSESLAVLSSIKNHLEYSNTNFRNLQLINAKVPILRFRDASNSIEIDLNFNNDVGVRNTHLLNWYTQLDERVNSLVTIVKLWAQHHNINDARCGTISSYSLVLMVIHFLQYACKPAIIPCLHRMLPGKFGVLHSVTRIEVMEQANVHWKSDNKKSLGELFVRFLDYYQNFDFAQNAISIRTGGVLPVGQCKSVLNGKNDPNQWLNLCIEEPFDQTNTARSLYDPIVFSLVKKVFFESWQRLKVSKDLDSVFAESFFPLKKGQTIKDLDPAKLLPLYGVNPKMPEMKLFSEPSYGENNKAKRAASNSSINGSSTASL